MMKFIDFIKRIFFFYKIKKLFRKQQEEQVQELKLNEEVVSSTQNPEIQQTSKGKNEAHSEEPEESKNQPIELKEEEVVPDFSNTVTAPDLYVSEGRKIPYQIIHNHSGKSHDGDDLPEIQKKSLAGKRSILYVLDMKTLHHDRIDADDFFSREPAEIARITRQLAEADQRNEDIYVCGCCHNRVKVAKYSNDQGNEVLAFIHCSQNVVCDWKKDYNFNDYYPEDYDVNEKNKFEKVKSIILESLQTAKSSKAGISNVKGDAIVRSKNSSKHWKRMGIYAQYKQCDLVIELLSQNVLMGVVEQKDAFCKENQIHILWVFGADEISGYDYIKKHVYQNALFNNHRNVFIIDEESISACLERKELVLKCNYLDPDNKWHYRKETTSSNGVLVTLDDLTFDEQTFKPYYVDTDKESNDNKLYKLIGNSIPEKSNKKVYHHQNLQVVVHHRKRFISSGIESKGKISDHWTEVKTSLTKHAIPSSEIKKEDFVSSVEYQSKSVWFFREQCRIVHDGKAFYLNVYKGRKFYKLCEMAGKYKRIIISEEDEDGWCKIKVSNRTVGFIRNQGVVIMYRDKKDSNDSKSIDLR